MVPVLVLQLLQLKQRLAQSMRQRLGFAAQQFLHQHSKLQLLHPARRLQQQQQRLDELQIRLSQAMQQRLARKSQQLQLQQKSLALVSPQQRLQRQQLQLQHCEHRVIAAEDAKFCTHGGIDWDAVEALAPMGNRARVACNIDTLVQQVVAAAQPGDHIVCMSNGGFGGIHGRLLTALQG